MNASSSDLSSLLIRCQSGMASILQQSSRPERAGAIADLLRELRPQAVLTGCLLLGEDSDSFAVRPEKELAHSERKQLLQSQLSLLDPLAAHVQKLPRELPPNVRIRASALNTNDRPHGFLLIGLSADASAEDAARAEALLAAAAPVLSLRLSLEAREREQRELMRFALLGQAFVGLSHELNNALNSMMLQTSVVQLRVDEQVRQELALIRQHGAQAAGLIRSLQYLVQERREQSYPVDLNSALAEILEEEAELRRRVSVERAMGSTRSRRLIHSTRSAIKQLVRLLLEGVCAGTEAAVKAETCDRDGSAVLTLTITDGKNAVLAVDELLWHALDEVSRLAGQSLLRQLGGVLTSERSDDGAAVLRIVWAAERSKNQTGLSEQ